MKDKRFGPVLLVFTLLSLLVVGVTNYVVNPYGYHEKEGQELYDLRGHMRLIKPNWFSKEDYTKIVLGSSRAQYAFDPSVLSELSDKKSSYNLSMAGMRYYELPMLLEYILSTRDPNQELELIVGADAFLMPFGFSKAKKEDLTWIPEYGSIFSPLKNSFDLWSKCHLSFTAFKNSASDIINQPKRRLVSLRNGHAIPENRFDISNPQKFYKLGFDIWEKKKNYKFGDVKLKAFEEFLDIICDQKNLKVKFVFLPIHNFGHLYFNKEDTDSKKPFARNAKFKMAKSILKKSKNCSVPLEYYDFMQVNNRTSHFKFDQESWNENFVDFSHCSVQYGNLIVKELYKSKSLKLGHKLTDIKSYQEFLKEQNTQLGAWEKKHQKFINQYKKN